jgi:hypothetical protein
LAAIAGETVARRGGGTASPAVDWHQTLEQYYPYVIAHRQWLGQVTLPSDPWQDTLARFDETALHAMRPTARAALVLLLLPIMRVAPPAPDVHQAERFMTAARNGYRQAAGDIINSWTLPAEAHNFLVDWITGTDFSS